MSKANDVTSPIDGTVRRKNEQKLWDEAVDGMDKGGRYQMANYCAHKYEHTENIEVAVLRRGDNILMIDKQGRVYMANDTLGNGRKGA